MKINDLSVVPTIVTDVTGRIILLNKTAKKELKLFKIGDNIGKYLDINAFTKLSMKSNVIDALEVNINDYEMAILRVSGEGLSKTVGITLHKIDECFDEILDSKVILSSLNGIELDNRIEKLELKKFGLDLINELRSCNESTYPHVNLYIDDCEFTAKALQLQALILCSIAMMHETSPKRPVDLYIKRRGEELEVKIIVRVDDNIKLTNVQAIEKIYPWTTIRFALIDDICEKSNIPYSATVLDKALKLRFMVREESREKMSLMSPQLFAGIFQHLISCLKPRERIVIKRIKATTEE